MNNKIKYTLISAFLMLSISSAYAQLPEGLADRYIRIAEMGELADSVNVWGDVTSSGRYIIPENTTLPELISFSLGYTPLRGLDSDINWTKTLIELKISRYDEFQKKVDVAMFRYRYNDPEPAKMFDFDLQNNDIVTVRVRRKPGFGDYVSVVAPVIGVLATSILLIQNLK